MWRHPAGTVVVFVTGVLYQVALATEPPTVARSSDAQGLGQLLIEDAQSGALQRLDVARYHVNVVLQPPVALVQIDQSFYNPYGQQREGTFVFNLPPGASVSRFAMYVTPDELIEGELIERRRAADIYDRIVSGRRDPAILEQIGDNLFRMRVFPVFARDTKRILLDYTIPLESDQGAYRFQLPLLSDLNPIWDFRLRGTVRGEVDPTEVRSLTHEQTTIEPRADGSVALELQKRMFQPDSDWILEFSEPESAEIDVRHFRAEPLPRDSQPGVAPLTDRWAHHEVSYFLATVPSASIADSATEAPPADVLILANTSAGIGDRQAVRDAVQIVASNLRPEDRFQIAAIDVAYRPLDDAWMTPGSEEAQRGLARFSEEFFLGGTDLQAGLPAALESFSASASDRRRVVVYVGAGIATRGDSDPAILVPQLRASFHDARASLSAVAVTSRAQAEREQARRAQASRAQADGSLADEGLARQEQELGFLRELTLQCGGSLLRADQHAWRQNLQSWTRAGLPPKPRIETVQIDGVAAEDLFYTESWQEGQPLRIYGRSLPRPDLTLQLAVRTGDQRSERRWDLHLDDERDDPFLGRLWAQRRLRQLQIEEAEARLAINPATQQQRSSAEERRVANEARQQIVQLSQEWSLLSPYTAFLVLETEADYGRWGIDRQVRRRYWKPAGKLDEAPLPDEWLRQVHPDAEPLEGDHATQAQQFTAAVEAAEEAMAAERFETARRLLDGVEGFPQAAESPTFQQLQQRALWELRRQALWETVRAHYPMLAVAQSEDRHRGLSAPNLLSRWSPLPHDGSPLDHPLSRRIPVAPVQLDLLTLAGEIHRLTELNVELDQRSLQELGVVANTKIDFRGYGEMSISSYLTHLLKQADLVWVEDEDRLLITSREQLEEMQTTEVYPVRDLLLTDRLPDRDDLWLRPRQEREWQAERRLLEKLKQPLSFHFFDVPLWAALHTFAHELGDTVLIDSRGLSEQGLAADVLIRARAGNLPARSGLRRILQDVDLDFYIADEALVISTREAVESNLRTRLHHGRGVLLSWPRQTLGKRGRRWDGGWGGGMGWGMGGMGGMAGGMGGMGGGMGFMGGSMGGSMGTGGGVRSGVGGAPAAPARTPAGGPVGLSQGGEVDPPTPEKAPHDETTPQEATPQEAVEPPVAAPPSDTPLVPPVAPQRRVDADALREIIATTISPGLWEEWGGPATMAFFEPTLDLVVAGTEHQHTEIESLLDRLRQLPDVALPPGAQAAEIPRIGPENIEELDPFALTEIVMTTVAPDVWEELGGPHAAVVDPTKLALVVLADQHVHSQVHRLLTLLRRSRYAAERSDRPWESSQEGLFAQRDWGEEPPQRLSELPEPSPAELDALNARHEPTGGAWTGQRFSVSDQTSLPLEFRQRGDRLELQLPEVTLRSAKVDAAVVYNSLTLVEHGPWSDAVRQAVDSTLPWLPHRSNRELAQMFEVQVWEVPTEEDASAEVDSADEGPDREVVLLRLTPIGIGEGAETYLKVGYARHDGLPVLWESYVAGEKVGQFRFLQRAAGEAPAYWKEVHWENSEGEVLLRWDLEAVETAEVNVPETTDHDPNYVHLDLRSEKPRLDGNFRDAVRAIQERQWQLAYGLLQRELERRPGQPLLRLLSAFCQRHGAQLGLPGEMLRDLERVAASTAHGLTRTIHQEFGNLSRVELYEILSQQPHETRTAADWERLARLALAAGHPEQALASIRHSRRLESTTKPTPGSGVEFELDVLLRLNRIEEAQQLADEALADRPGTESPTAKPPTAKLAQLFADYGASPFADTLLRRELEHDEITAATRYQLTRQRADLHEGMARWRLLVSGLESLAEDSPAWEADMERLVRELTLPAHAESAAALVDETRQKAVRHRLLLRQAQLTLDPARAAELVWQLVEERGLPVDEHEWACSLLNRAGQGERVITLLESRLRRDEDLSAPLLDQLARAYRAAGREVDARRARG